MSRLQHKVGRKSNYVIAMQVSGTWNEVRRKIRLRDNFECQHCGATHNLEVHHKTYYKNGISIVGNELNHLDCLVLLCEKCHRNVHRQIKQYDLIKNTL